VYEKYAPGHDASTIEPSFSVSKSFTSTIIGMLVERGPLKLDARAPVPEWRSPADPRHAITLRNILNMSSGLQWNEDYSNGTSDVFQMIQAGDEAAYVIAKPLAFTPGSAFHYSTGDTEILGRIIADTAGVRGDAYRAYLHRRLLDPLGINPVNVGFDQVGIWHAGWETNTTTRNFAKLGLLYLRDGVWEHRQFLSQKWVDFVRTPSSGSSGYGGQFWLQPDGSFEMVGLFGQLVHIVPQLDLVIAVNNGFGDDPMLNAFRDAAPATCDR
jgi:CubicO group peptidase (beta-lactamase class C family)